jgi:hypothetical protein
MAPILSRVRLEEEMKLSGRIPAGDTEIDTGSALVTHPGDEPCDAWFMYRVSNFTPIHSLNTITIIDTFFQAISKSGYMVERMWKSNNANCPGRGR